jgi:2-haloacid dehalogenase
MTAHCTTVVFDLGGVLIDWNPRYLYRKLFHGDEAAMELFLSTVCTSDWNAQQDAGRTFAEAESVLKQQFPDHAEMIDAWFARHGEMVNGPIQGTVDILAELRAQGTPIYALSNWSIETYPTAEKRFDFLKWFNGILLSGNVRLIKPDPRIFQLFFKTHGIDPADAIYIDDLPRNVKSATAQGMYGIVFTNPQALRIELAKLGLLTPIGQISHVAAWVENLERARSFYERWFKAESGPLYKSQTRNFQSYFLSLGSGTRLELMKSPEESPRGAHIAISVGSREAVDHLIKKMQEAGVKIVSQPRVTGDGYYETVIADSEGNLVEVTL